MPYNDDENHSPSEFYYPEQTNDPKNTAERLAVKAFFGLSYKVATNCNPTKPYNKSLINLVCSVCAGKYCLRFLSHSPCSFVARSVRKTSGNTFPYRPPTRLISPYYFVIIRYIPEAHCHKCKTKRHFQRFP